MSTHKELERIKIFDGAGQQVLTGTGNNTYSMSIDVSKLTPGIYFIEIDGIGFGKFIVKN